MAEGPIEVEVGNGITLTEESSPPEELPEPKIKQSAPIQQYTGRPVLLHDRYAIDPSTSIPEMDGPSAKAYSVKDNVHPNRNLFALVCNSDLPTRIDVMVSVQEQEIDGLIPLISWGTLNWPLMGKHSMALIYELPRGGLIIRAIENKELQLNELEIQKRILPPIITGIVSLSELGHVHRSIRPSNIFFMDESLQILVLGNCVTSPCGFDQPIIFETIERSTSSPGGRGQGTFADDIYALGVTLALLLLGKDHMDMIGEEKLLDLKLQRGSYDAICGNANFPSTVSKLLRGMLDDNVNARWGKEELNSWVEGSKVPSVKQAAAINAQNPYHFENNVFYNTRSLSLYLSRHLDTAMEIINDKKLINWLQKDIKNKKQAHSLSTTIEHDVGQKTVDYVIARVA